MISIRYLSTLYSHPEWPQVHPRVIRDTLRENIDDNWMWLMVTPSWMYRHLKIIMDKKRRGQPVSFTDFFGYLVGDTILKDVSCRHIFIQHTYFELSQLSQRIIQSKAKFWEEEQFSIECHKTNDNVLILLLISTSKQKSFLLAVLQKNCFKYLHLLRQVRKKQICFPPCYTRFQ